MKVFLNEADNCFTVDTGGYSERSVMMVRSCAGGKYDRRSRLWHWIATPHAAWRLGQVFDGEAEIDDGVRNYAAAHEVVQNRLTDPVESFRESVKALLSATRFEPYECQYRGIALGLSTVAGLFFDMGTGKTKTAIDTMRCADEVGYDLILCPKAVINVWPHEMSLHDYGQPVFPVTKGSSTDKAKMVKTVLDDPDYAERGAAFIINYDSAWRGKLGNILKGVRWRHGVLDESHRIKSPGGKASKFCGDLAWRCTRRLALTGTPMPHSPLDIYAQFRFLDPSIFGTSFAAFRNRYARLGGFGGKEVVGWQNQEELSDKVYSYAIRVNIDDVIDLPEAVHTGVEIELPAAALKVYKGLEDKLEAEVAGGLVTASNALTRLLRLQQVTAGWVTVELDGDPDNCALREVHSEKRLAAEEWMADLPATEPLVCFGRFRSDLDSIKQAAENSNRHFYELSGRVNQLSEWQHATDGDVLGVQMQAGGAGVDLTRSRYALYFSMGFSLGDYKQTLARLRRKGQSRPVVYTHLIGKDTVDGIVYNALSNREAVVEAVLENYDRASRATGGRC